MNNITVYKIWAPDDALWTEWAKPVLFIKAAGDPEAGITVPLIQWLPQRERDTAVVVDLPGIDGVYESLGLADMGYRPVPLYNGVYGPNNSAMIVKVEGIVAALYEGAKHLEQCNLEFDAPPAFILDSDRMSGLGREPGKFDNRWCVFPQDMPSAGFLLQQGIRKVIIRSNEIQNDLSHILRRYQEQGIQILSCDDSGIIKEINVVRPSRFKSLFYRFEVIAGLKRNGTGGFGGKIPEATQSSSGGRYYGLG